MSRPVRAAIAALLLLSAGCATGAARRPARRPRAQGLRAQALGGHAQERPAHHRPGGSLQPAGVDRHLGGRGRHRRSQGGRGAGPLRRAPGVPIEAVRRRHPVLGPAEAHRRLLQRQHVVGLHHLLHDGAQGSAGEPDAARGLADHEHRRRRHDRCVHHRARSRPERAAPALGDHARQQDVRPAVRFPVPGRSPAAPADRRHARFADRGQAGARPGVREGALPAGQHHHHHRR